MLTRTGIIGKNGAALSLRVTGAATGEFRVGYFGPNEAAELHVDAIENGTSVLQDEAVSGTIHIDTFEAGNFVVGRYDVVMRSGEQLTGTFDAAFCEALGITRRPVGEQLVCVGGSTADTNGKLLSCNGGCACGESMKFASCSRPSADAGWTCTCNVAGKTFTCGARKEVGDACSSSWHPVIGEGPDCCGFRSPTY